MPTLPVPIFQPTYRGVDQVELSEDNFALLDGYRSPKGGTVSRPGSSGIFTWFAGTGRGMDGMFYWREANQVIAVSDGEVFELSYAGDVPVIQSRALTAKFLETEGPVSFASNGANLFMANGGRIVTLPTVGGPAYVGDADAPTLVSHVAYLDTYILANQLGTNQFFWSNVLDPSNWSALNFASAAGNPDNIVALHVYNREIYLFGPASIEIWENDGSTPFKRVPGGFIESGCSAAHSVITDENALYWLDHDRRFVRFGGKSVERLSTPYDKEVQAFRTIADCRAFRMSFESNTFFVFQFPSANRTLVYNKDMDEWAEWGRWNAEAGSYDPYIGNCYAYAEPWGLHLIGRRDKQVVARVSRDFSTDDGDTIRLARVTGHVDYGTLKEKRSDEFRVRLRRGDGIASGTPSISVRFQDNGRYWSQPRKLSLGKLGEYDMIGRLFRTGMFRTRRYEFVATDAVPVVFTDAEEDIEVLR